MSLRYPAKFIAEYFINLANEEGKDLTPLHLQKLTFLAHGYLLGKTGRPLIQETIEAWPYGPVIPELYSLYRHFGKKPVESLFRKNQPVLLDEALAYLQKDEQVLKALMDVWKEFKHKSAMSLTNLTHEPDSPWDKCYRILSRNPIPNDIIEEFYSEQSS